MKLETQEHVENTRAKIRLLEERYRTNEAEASPMTETRRLTMRSLRRMINQMTEDIVRFVSRAKSMSSPVPFVPVYVSTSEVLFISAVSVEKFQTCA